MSVRPCAARSLGREGGGRATPWGMAGGRGPVSDRSMKSRHPLTLAVAATAALAPAASAQTPQPTLQFDRSCYTEHQEMRFNGTGYTPGGEVGLFIARVGEVLGQFSTMADGAGAIADFMLAGEDQLLAEDEERETRYVTANDQTRIEQDTQPPDSQFGFAEF